MFQETWFTKFKKCPIIDFSKSHLCTDFGANTKKNDGNYTYLHSRRGLAKSVNLFKINKFKKYEQANAPV